MSELILLKSPEIFHSIGGDEFHGERVVGVTAANSQTLTEHEYNPTGREVEEALRISDFTSDKFVEFYTRCRVAKPENRPPYSCHLFAWYITGAVVDLEMYDRYSISQTLPASNMATEPGKIYGIETAEGYIPHSVVGIERPDYNLSMLGDNNPMVIVGNTSLVSLYGGAAINEMIPESASFDYRG